VTIITIDRNTPSAEVDRLGGTPSASGEHRQEEHRHDFGEAEVERRAAGSRAARRRVGALADHRQLGKRALEALMAAALAELLIFGKRDRQVVGVEGEHARNR
jgi:hypothetical protein